MGPPSPEEPPAQPTPPPHCCPPPGFQARGHSPHSHFPVCFWTLAQWSFFPSLLYTSVSPSWFLWLLLSCLAQGMRTWPQAWPCSLKVQLLWAARGSPHDKSGWRTSLWRTLVFLVTALSWPPAPGEAQFDKQPNPTVLIYVLWKEISTILVLAFSVCEAWKLWRAFEMWWLIFVIHNIDSLWSHCECWISEFWIIIPRGKVRFLPAFNHNSFLNQSTRNLVLCVFLDKDTLLNMYCWLINTELNS